MKRHREIPDFEPVQIALERFSSRDLEKIDKSHLLPAGRYIRNDTEFLLTLYPEEIAQARSLFSTMEEYQSFIASLEGQTELIEAFERPDLMPAAFMYSPISWTVAGVRNGFDKEAAPALYRRAIELNDLVMGATQEFWIVGRPLEVGNNLVAAKLEGVTVTESDEIVRLEPVIRNKDGDEQGLLPANFYPEAVLHSRHPAESL